MDREIQRHPDGAHVAVVGATGAVGREMLHCLEALKLPIRKLDLLASSRSAGKTLDTPWGNLTIQEADSFDFRGVDIALFSAGKAVSEALAPRVLEASVAFS